MAGIEFARDEILGGFRLPFEVLFSGFSVFSGDVPFNPVEVNLSAGGLRTAQNRISPRAILVLSCLGSDHLKLIDF